MKTKFLAALLFLLTLPLPLTAGASQPLFEPYVNFPVADYYPEAVGVGDFNNDGLNDVAMTAYAQFHVFLQKSDGSLDTPVAYDARSRTTSLAVGDLNHDDRDDIVIAHPYSNNINVFLQQADGTLAPRVVYPVSTTPDSVAVGDVNNDGLDDIAISHWNVGEIGIITQTDLGTLSPMVTYPSPQAGYDDISIGDINNDGRNDVIKMNGQGLNPNLSVYLQSMDGTLTDAVSYSVSNCSGFCNGSGMDVGDVTGDHLNDVILSYDDYSSGSKIAVFSQGQDGTLDVSISYPAFESAEPVEVADVNADGLADVLTLHGGWNRAGVFLQENGMLSPVSTYQIPYASHYKPQGFDVGDINGDSLPDIVIADYNNGLVVLYHTPPDQIPPVITVTATNEDGTPYLADTWTNQTVTLKFTCVDEGSGTASCPADQVFEAEGVTLLASGTATDYAGNHASANFGPIKIDKTAPELFVEVSANPVVLNGYAELLANATDELSGVRPGPCMNVDTSSVGLKSGTCYIVDHAGNQASKTVEYRVVYDFEGFFNPVVDCVNNTCDGFDLSIIQPGSSIPLKFRLKDANGNTVRSASTPLWLKPMALDYLPYNGLPADYVIEVTDIPYEWKKGQDQYVYEWSTKGMPAPTIWLAGVRLDDGMTYYVFIALIK